MAKGLGVLLRLMIGISLVWVIYWLRGKVWLRLYPLLIIIPAWGTFLFSLFNVPLVEKIARKRGHKLDAKGVIYTRRVTQAWVIFLTIHLAVTTWSLWWSQAHWALYNGCIAYFLLGAMFLGEFLIRRKVLAHAIR